LAAFILVATQVPQADLSDLVIHNATKEEVVLGVYAMEGIASKDSTPSLGGEFLQPGDLDHTRFFKDRRACHQSLAVSLRLTSGKNRFLYLDRANLCGDHDHPAELMIFDDMLKVKLSTLSRFLEE
jgi:hypothetical protein